MPGLYEESQLPLIQADGQGRTSSPSGFNNKVTVITEDAKLTFEHHADSTARRRRKRPAEFLAASLQPRHPEYADIDAVLKPVYDIDNLPPTLRLRL
jgi:hypothetical protein